MEKWLKIASTNLGISQQIALAIFHGALAATKCANYNSKMNGQNIIVVPIPFICTEIALMEADGGEQNNLVEFIRKNAGNLIYSENIFNCFSTFLFLFYLLRIDIAVHKLSQKLG